MTRQDQVLFNLVFEPIMMILLATGAGVSLVLYTITPRRYEAPAESFRSGISFIETIYLPSESITQLDAAPVSGVSVQSPTVSFGSVSTGIAGVPAAGGITAASS